MLFSLLTASFSDIISNFNAPLSKQTGFLHYFEICCSSLASTWSGNDPCVRLSKPKSSWKKAAEGKGNTVRFLVLVFITRLKVAFLNLFQIVLFVNIYYGYMVMEWGGKGGSCIHKLFECLCLNKVQRRQWKGQENCDKWLDMSILKLSFSEIVYFSYNIVNCDALEVRTNEVRMQSNHESCNRTNIKLS